MSENENARIVMPATLEIERRLPATPETVWKYLADPEMRKQWFCAGETGTKAGEPFVMDFDHSRISNSPPTTNCGDAVVVSGTIVVFEPPIRLVYDWPGAEGETATRVSIRLEPDGEFTRLHLTHERLGNVEFKRGASAGWHAHLDLLADIVSGNKPRDFWLHYEPLKKEYDRRILS